MDDLIQASWGVEKWLKDAWELVNNEEKLEITNRVNEIFKDGLPLELKHDKIIYSHIFAMLSQLEVLAVQIPLKFLSHIKNDKLTILMRRQLIDEIFHTVVFSKIAYELAAPYSFPPAYNESIEQMCTFITEEKDIKTTIILLNLVGEGWIEQIFDVLSEHNVSSKVFDTILEDERRHVAEAQLYESLGSADISYLKEKLAIIEDQLISNVFFQKTYVFALMNIMGVEGCIHLINKINDKHHKQLKTINLKPTKKWTSFVEMFPLIINQIMHNSKDDQLIHQNSTRKFMLSAWDAPKNPTLFSMFHLDVSKFKLLEKKYPDQTITCLILQTMSKVCSENPELKNYICHNKLYNAKENFIHLVVKLPSKKNHLAFIKFKDCHLMSLNEVSKHIKHDFEIMSYCLYKVNEIIKKNPDLLKKFYAFYIPDSNDVYKNIYIQDPVISLSNVAPWGHEEALSPLLPFETLKLTIATIEKKPIWNYKNKIFDAKDMLPIGVSADHRIHDGDLGTKKMFQIAFNEILDNFESNQNAQSENKYSNLKKFVEYIDEAIVNDLEFTFRFLMLSSQKWNNNIDLNSLSRDMIRAIA